MNFNCIIKTGLVAVAAMVSLSSFSQDLIARQAPIDKKLKSVDSLALQKQIRAEQSEYPALSLYPNWNNQYAHSYGNAIIPETYTIDLTGFRMPTPSTKITSPFGDCYRRMDYLLFSESVRTGSGQKSGFHPNLLPFGTNSEILIRDEPGYRRFGEGNHPGLYPV